MIMNVLVRSKQTTKQSQGENKITLGYMHVTRF